jgi:hypothetical protein
MGLFDKVFGRGKGTETVGVPPPPPKPPATPKKPRKPRVKKEKVVPQVSAKDMANFAGEPYIAVISVEVDKENIGNGAFELDWNDKFIAQLVRAGYQVKPNEPENEIVDRWFQDVCRNVVLETFEQYEANNPRGINRKDIGNGRTEIS